MQQKKLVRAGLGIVVKLIREPSICTRINYSDLIKFGVLLSSYTGFETVKMK
jgi:hypothetical protein